MKKYVITVAYLLLVLSCKPRQTHQFKTSAQKANQQTVGYQGKTLSPNTQNKLQTCLDKFDPKKLSLFKEGDAPKRLNDTSILLANTVVPKALENGQRLIQLEVTPKDTIPEEYIKHKALYLRYRLCDDIARCQGGDQDKSANMYSWKHEDGDGIPLSLEKIPEDSARVFAAIKVCAFPRFLEEGIEDPCGEWVEGEIPAELNKDFSQELLALDLKIQKERIERSDSLGERLNLASKTFESKVSHKLGLRLASGKSLLSKKAESFLIASGNNRDGEGSIKELLFLGAVDAYSEAIVEEAQFAADEESLNLSANNSQTDCFQAMQGLKQDGFQLTNTVPLKLGVEHFSGVFLKVGNGNECLYTAGKILQKHEGACLGEDDKSQEAVGIPSVPMRKFRIARALGAPVESYYIHAGDYCLKKNLNIAPCKISSEFNIPAEILLNNDQSKTMLKIKDDQKRCLAIQHDSGAGFDIPVFTEEACSEDSLLTVVHDPSAGGNKAPTQENLIGEEAIDLASLLKEFKDSFYAVGNTHSCLYATNTHLKNGFGACYTNLKRANEALQTNETIYQRFELKNFPTDTKKVKLGKVETLTKSLNDLDSKVYFSLKAGSKCISRSLAVTECKSISVETHGFSVLPFKNGQYINLLIQDPVSKQCMGFGSDKVYMSDQACTAKDLIRKYSEGVADSLYIRYAITAGVVGSLIGIGLFVAGALGIRALRTPAKAALPPAEVKAQTTKGQKAKAGARSAGRALGYIAAGAAILFGVLIIVGSIIGTVDAFLLAEDTRELMTADRATEAYEKELHAIDELRKASVTRETSLWRERAQLLKATEDATASDEIGSEF